MNSSALVFLGVVAAGSLIQAVALVILFRQGLRIVRQLDEAQTRLGSLLEPAVEDLSRATDHLAEASIVTLSQVHRLEAVADDVAVRLGEARAILEDVVLPSATRIMTIWAVARSVRRLIGFLRGARD